jgi:hypothetical protein
MLDVIGLVVDWHEAREKGTGDDRDAVLHHHVSQFYLPEDIASSIPLLHLRTAVAEGRSEERGWRKRPDGVVFWATTTIRAVWLRGGALQGFSHIVRESKDPWIAQHGEAVRDLQQREQQARWQPRDGVFGSTATGTQIQ